MKVLGVASGGGHVVELLRLQPAFDDHELIYMSTLDSYADTFRGYAYHTIPDFSQWNVYKIPRAAMILYRLMARIRPDVVITTGAAPGVLALFIGWLLGATTIWVEASCHTEKVSISGKVCALFASRVYTQWEHLATPKFVYSGNVIK
ncbi:oligosaccharide biosynthesis protein Alg14 [Flaviaesturariibacter terrae]